MIEQHTPSESAISPAGPAPEEKPSAEPTRDPATGPRTVPESSAKPEPTTEPEPADDADEFADAGGLKIADADAEPTEEDEFIAEEERIEKLKTERLVPKDRPVSFDPTPAEALPETAIRARVISMSSDHFRVQADTGSYLVHLAKKLLIRERKYRHPVAVGDEVIILPLPTEGTQPRAQLLHVLERQTVLSRPVSRHRKRRVSVDDVEQILVANVDRAIIVYPGNQEVRTHLIDRFLVATERGGMDCVIVVNKADMIGERRAEFERTLAQYRELGTPGVITSAITGEGVAELREFLHGHISVFIGQSGVGKSSLLNAVQPGLHLRTSEVNRKTGRGRHTTTTVHLLPLAVGGYVVDTPGIREFGLHDLSADDVFKYFEEIAEASEHCKFRNCTHTGREPGCAVLAAVEKGEILQARYNSFLALFQSIEDSQK